MCTVEIKSRFSTNDLNGSRKSINTHPHFLPKAHLNLILALQVEVYASYLRVNRIKSLRGPFVPFAFRDPSSFVWLLFKTSKYPQEMMHRIDQDTHRRTWALVTLKDARLVNYVMLVCC
ncbi:hypothetical protein HanXRQr2_Chr12g0556461 [Helianthus annuus]|uniref:Uncharacterized protein n=1 Tax=Helianthus annuus TaxID=4232 RepID=A0A251T4W6_HELAN|nr:hypothetical protein HanXRQr2_Chr12g0556461 [Helianthus annuus]